MLGARREEGLASCDKPREPQAGFDPRISNGETRRDELSLQPAEYIGGYEPTRK